MSDPRTAARLPVEVIETERVRLRPYRESDAADLVTGMADPDLHRFLPDLPDPYTARDAVEWITRGAPAAWRRGWAAYAMVDPATDRVIGGCALSNPLPHLGQIEIGYWVTASARGLGAATSAARALTGYAFAHGYGRVELLTRLENPASQRVAIAAGFHREGLRRGARPERGPGVLGGPPERGDRVVWARLVDDPSEPSPRLLPDLPGGALTDGVVTLRPPRPGDEPFLHRLHGLPDVVASSVPPVAPDGAEVALRVARSAFRWLAGERADLVVTDAASGAPAGDIGLYYSEPSTGQGMVGYSLLPEWRGRGFATRAVVLLARWAFDAGVLRLIAGTRPENAASQRVLARAGFRREGYQRERLPGPAGTRVDDVLYALLPADLPPAAPGAVAPAGPVGWHRPAGAFR
nr:GNAT family N-acetyltransferase [Micromonospora sp. NBRC 107566]